jgi:hypothetical protein
MLDFLGYKTGIGFDVLIILAIYVGFSHFVSKFNQFEIDAVSKTIVWSALIPSLISYVEYRFFESVLNEFWTNTGGFRSSSTLLNPNNYGIFLGCCLVVLFYSNLFNILERIILGSLLFGALLMTGSRTAMLSLVLACLAGGMYRGHGKIRVNYFLNYCLLIIFGVGALMSMVNFGVLPERILDPLTALIRLEKYFEFLINIDINYLAPDFSGARVDMVSESGYFHLINSVGLICFFATFILGMLYFRSQWIFHIFSNHPGRYFDVALLYYVIAMFFENVLMSFPNNQLMFIVFGGSVFYYGLKKNS